MTILKKISDSIKEVTELERLQAATSDVDDSSHAALKKAKEASDKALPVAKEKLDKIIKQFEDKQVLLDDIQAWVDGSIASAKKLNNRLKVSVLHKVTFLRGYPLKVLTQLSLKITKDGNSVVYVAACFSHKVRNGALSCEGYEAHYERTADLANSALGNNYFVDIKPINAEKLEVVLKEQGLIKVDKKESARMEILKDVPYQYADGKIVIKYKKEQELEALYKCYFEIADSRKRLFRDVTEDLHRSAKKFGNLKMRAMINFEGMDSYSGQGSSDVPFFLATESNMKDGTSVDEGCPKVWVMETQINLEIDIQSAIGKFGEKATNEMLKELVRRCREFMDLKYY